MHGLNQMQQVHLEGNSLVHYLEYSIRHLISIGVSIVGRRGSQQNVPVLQMIKEIT